MCSLSSFEYSARFGELAYNVQAATHTRRHSLRQHRPVLLFLRITTGWLLFCCWFSFQAKADLLGGWGLVQFSTTSNNGYPPLQVVCSTANGCSGTTPVYGTSGLDLSYYVYGSADYGVLRGYAEESISGSVQSGSIDPSMYLVANGQSYFGDSFTIFGGPIGTVGTLTAVFTVSGTHSSSGGFAPVMFVYEASSPHLCGSPVGDKIICNGIPIVFGQAVDISFQMNTVLNVYDFTAGSSAVADYAHSSMLTGIDIKDANGNPVSNFSISSSSGTQYTPNGVVPEPNAIFLTATVIGAVGLRLRTKQRRNR